LQSERFGAALGRQFLFTTLILLIEIPLGMMIALGLPAKGWRASMYMMLLALPLLIPWNVVGTIWQIFGRVDIGLAGAAINAAGFDYNYAQNSFDAWATIIRMALDLARRFAVLRGFAFCTAGLLPGSSHRWCVSLGDIPLCATAAIASGFDHRIPSTLHGQLHDLH